MAKTLDNTITKPSALKPKPPSLYKVLLHNDDYTTMDFVVEVLQQFFNKTTEQAMAIMLKVHHEGVGVCGIYAQDIAETKRQQVMQYAKEHAHPLQCSIEPV